MGGSKSSLNKKLHRHISTVSFGAWRKYDAVEVGVSAKAQLYEAGEENLQGCGGKTRHIYFNIIK